MIKIGARGAVGGRMILGLCFAAGSVACDSLERETLDRVTPHDASTWTSRSDCEQLLAEREQSSRPPRIGSWNIRYFPDADESEQTSPDEATDVAWVACAIASLDVDVLAVQEFKSTDVAVEKQQELIDTLNALTSGDWQLELAPCEPKEVQHPGFLFDKTRVSGSLFREVPSLNPDPVCSNAVSPGFGGYFSIEGGPDFHLIAVHSHTGSSRESYEKRAAITAAMEEVVADAYALEPDTDVVFAGDFNSVGCTTCDTVLSNQDEVAELEQVVAGFEPSLALLPASQRCTRVAEDVPFIDHVVAAASMTEVPADSVVRVAGICEAIECDRQVNWLEDAYERLSDHCPLVLDLAASDDD
jgi:endonuclease/exonuclease/phosphatase family metal-dependent hydrolase